MALYGDYIYQKSAEEAKELILSNQTALAEKLAKGTVSGDDLTNFALVVQNCEGQVEAFSIADGVIDSVNAKKERGVVDGADAKIKKLTKRRVTRILVNGPKDTYSGRGNDGVRARFDGFCEAAEMILNHYDD